MCIRLILSYVLYITIAFSPHSALAKPPFDHDKPAEILVLNSYHPGFPWTDNIAEKIEKNISESGIIATFDHYYMDTKKGGFGDAYRDNLAKLYRKTIKPKRYDLIIASDDNAVLFIRDHHEDIFNKAPVAFTGLNDPNILKTLNRNYFTGVMEIAEAEETLNLIGKVQPEARRILLIFDDTRTSNALYRQLESLFSLFTQYEFERIDSNNSMDQLTNRLSKLDKSTAVLLGSFFTDINGRFFNEAQGVKLISEASAVPVFTLYKRDVTLGGFGGKVLDGQNAGIAVSEKAIKILRSENPADIAITHAPSAGYYINYDQLEKFGIDQELLPVGTQFKNDHEHFFKAQAKEVAIFAAIFFISLLTIICLYFINQRLKDSKVKFDELFNAIDTAIFQIGPKGDTITANIAAREMFSNDFCIDDNKYLLTFELPFIREDGSTVSYDERPIIRALESGETINNEILGFINQHTHKTHWYQINVKPRIDPATQEADYVFATFTDITDYHVTAQHVSQIEKMNALGHIVAGLAHDFNNALASIIGNLELLKQPKTNKRNFQLVQNALAAANQCGELTKRLVSFSQPKSASQKPENITKLLPRISAFLPRVIGQEIKILTDIQASDWNCKINASEFENALVNLAVNARDAMEGRGVLNIFSRERHVPEDHSDPKLPIKPGDYVEIGIADTGSGIPLGNQARIFEPFFTTKEIGNGTGLGLSMVYGFIKRANGELRVGSTTGRGTTIHMFLPRTNAPAPIANPDAEKKDNTELPVGLETILLVDDEPFLLDTTSLLLNRLGYQVIKAETGDDAYQILQEKPDIDLVLSDVVMPGDLDGFSLAQKATQLRPDLKVVLSSGFTEHPSLRNNGSKAIAHDARLPIKLPKPYNLEQLATVLRNTLDVPNQPSEKATPANGNGINDSGDAGTLRY